MAIARGACPSASNFAGDGVVMHLSPRSPDMVRGREEATGKNPAFDSSQDAAIGAGTWGIDAVPVCPAVASTTKL